MLNGGRETDGSVDFAVVLEWVVSVQCFDVALETPLVPATGRRHNDDDDDDE